MIKTVREAMERKQRERQKSIDSNMNELDDF
jgi:hypothetical protein